MTCKNEKKMWKIECKELFHPGSFRRRLVVTMFDECLHRSLLAKQLKENRVYQKQGNFLSPSIHYNIKSHIFPHIFSAFVCVFLSPSEKISRCSSKKLEVRWRRSFLRNLKLSRFTTFACSKIYSITMLANYKSFPFCSRLVSRDYNWRKRDMSTSGKE